MMYKVLCVDDDANMLKAYSLLRSQGRQKQQGYEIDTAGSGQAGLEALARRGPYAVILADYRMPGLNGIEFLRRARQESPQSMRMMVTGFADLDTAVEALNEGWLFRFLTKPCSLAALSRDIAAAVEQYQLAAADKELLALTLGGSVKALTDVLALANPAAFACGSRIQRLVRQLALELGADSLWEVELSAMLSQVGCLTVAEQTLRKVRLGAKLDSDEAAAFSRHPRVGHDLIVHIPRLGEVARAIAYQQKNFDGSGSPCDALKGAEIPLAARILKVAIDYDVLQLRNLSPADILERLEARRGHYDPAVLKALAAGQAPPQAPLTEKFLVSDLVGMLDKPAKTKELRLGNLVEGQMGMVLAEDVFAEDDSLVLRKGHEITVGLLERLRSLSRHMKIREPIRVLMPPLQR
jgi:response regulator RpfG family c-di-GMP phosphodiesterase